MEVGADEEGGGRRGRRVVVGMHVRQELAQVLCSLSKLPKKDCKTLARTPDTAWDSAEQQSRWEHVWKKIRDRGASGSDLNRSGWCDVLVATEDADSLNSVTHHAHVNRHAPDPSRVSLCGCKRRLNGCQ
eukprot:1447490-Rhodomonas_salina.2